MSTTTSASGSAPAKVTFVALNYAPSLGGAQELIRHIAEGLVARGVEVEVLTSDALRSPTSRDPGRIGIPREVIGGVEVRRYAGIAAVARAQYLRRMAWGRFRKRFLPRPEGRAKPPARYGPWTLGLIRAVRRATATSDVVVGCSAPFSTMFLPPRLGRGRRASIVTMPLLHQSPTALHPQIGEALRSSDVVVAMTEHEADLVTEAAVPRAHVRVIPPGTDVGAAPERSPSEARRQLGLPDRPTVGFVGRLAAYKGVDTLLAAAPAIWSAHPDTTVLLAGSPVGWTGYRSPEVAALGGDRFVIREGYADDERDLLLQACDVVVHPSRHESFGMIAIEAWSVRRPVVLADLACVRSFVEPGRTGELVPPGDDEALAAAVVGLLDDPDRRTALAEAGRAEAEAHFDWSGIADRWLETVQEVR